MSVSEFELERFHAVQDDCNPSRLEQALAELRAGRKTGHWIWFVLPQLSGIGRSAMARRYAISSLQEAKAYLEDHQLRTRLEDVISTIAEQLQRPEQSLAQLRGRELDASKTISCLTLFETAGLESGGALLDQLGKRCPLTLRGLNTNK